MARKIPWLEEVKRDAERITLKRIRENQEEQEYQASKTEETTEETSEETQETQSEEEVQEETQEEQGYEVRTDKNSRNYYVGPDGKRVSKEEYEANK